MANFMLSELIGRLMDLPNEVLRVLSSLVDKLRGKDREVWFAALKRFLRKEDPWTMRLNLVARDITVQAEAFAKDSFFGKSGPVKLWFGSNFENWVLPTIPDTVPAFQATLTKAELTKEMSDSEILSDLWNPKPFTVPEFAAVIRRLTKDQPNGEPGPLLTNGYANIFYVQLPASADGEDGRVVVVFVSWNSYFRDWSLSAHGLDVGIGRWWLVGRCVFSHSLPVPQAA